MVCWQLRSAEDVWPSQDEFDGICVDVEDEREPCVRNKPHGPERKRGAVKPGKIDLAVEQCIVSMWLASRVLAILLTDPVERTS